MTSALPFEGLRVLDLSHFWSGPYLTTYLGGYGADVVKIESIQHIDAWRMTVTGPELGDRWHERGLLWQASNLNKRDVTLNLRLAEGLALLRELCAGADVFVENYTVRVIDQLGLGYGALRELNPRIIMVRLPGFGLEGPARDYVGWGDAFEQISGLATVTGYPDGRPQTPGGYMDPMVGMHAGVALLAALEHRDRTGKGQLIEVSQIEVAASMAAEQFIAGEHGRPARRTGNRTPAYAPQGVYATGDEAPEYVALSIRDDEEWRRLLDVMGNPTELIDPSLASAAARHARHGEIDRAIVAWSKTMKAENLSDVLLGAGIPAARLLRPVRFTDEPQLVARQYYQELTHPLSGPRLFPTFPARYSFEPDRHVHTSAAPMLGQHNAEVLGRELGLSDDELAELEARRCIGTLPLPREG